jgi:hypothetical protein
MVLAFIESAVRPSCLPHQLWQLGDIRRGGAKYLENGPVPRFVCSLILNQ